MTLRGHTNAVVSLAQDPNSSYQMVSGSHDGTCRVWDIRSVRSEATDRVGESVYVIERESAKGKRAVAGEGVKVFGVCWDREIGVVSGGEDKQVQINSSSISRWRERGWCCLAVARYPVNLNCTTVLYLMRGSFSITQCLAHAGTLREQACEASTRP